MNTTIKAELTGNDFLNAYTTIDYLTRIKEYAMNTFKWVNLPKSVDARFIEEQLFEKGKICFFKDKTLGFLCLPVNEEGFLNVYNHFNIRRIYASNGFRRTRKISNSVIIYNNYLKTPTFITANLYAIRLSQVQRTIDINLNAQRTPILISCTPQQRLTLKNLYKKYEGNEPVIFADAEFNVDSVRVLNTKAPYLVNDLALYKHDLWNEVFTFLGINNANQDKRERLVASEVDANDEQVEQARFNMLDARLDACKLINDMFGLDISVKFRNDEVQQQFEKWKAEKLYPLNNNKKESESDE